MLKSFVRVGMAVAVVVGIAIVSGPADAGARPRFTRYTVTDGSNPVTGGEPTIGYDPIRNVALFGASAHE